MPAAVAEKPLIESAHSPKPRSLSASWAYEEAFCRNLGLISREEQQKLRHSRIAIAGMGGVGGVHLTTLARLGIGKFTIADPDAFELANFNRQAGANIETLGQGKAEAMAAQVRLINPQIEIRTFAEPITKSNVSRFLDGADIFVDGVDFFAIESRRLLFAEARRRGMWSITAGPHGFGTAWLIFSPNGVSFDEYFDIDDSSDDVDKLVAFSVGCVPPLLHLKYVRLAAYFQPTSGKGASLGLACQLASGVVAAETAKIILNPSSVRTAPWYAQFDPYCGRLRRGYLWGGNRHPWQRMKRWWLRKQMRRASSVSNNRPPA